MLLEGRERERTGGRTVRLGPAARGQAASVARGTRSALTSAIPFPDTVLSDGHRLPSCMGKEKRGEGQAQQRVAPTCSEAFDPLWYEWKYHWNTPSDQDSPPFSAPFVFSQSLAE